MTKTTTMKTLNFGIELEYNGLNRRALGIVVQRAIGGTLTEEPATKQWIVTDPQGREWRMVPDGSLTGGEFLSGEIVSPILGYDDIERVKEIVRATKRAGVTINDSTAIHVHIGVERFDAPSLVRLVKMMHKQERLIEHAFCVSPSRQKRYCKPIDAEFLARLEAQKPETLAELNEAWYGYHNPKPKRYDPSRYAALNLNSAFLRGSLELRFFQGTTEPDEVVAYLHFALALAAKALHTKSASSRRRVFNPATAKYDFRVLLNSLGLSGNEFKVTRRILLAGLGGSAAWKGERRDSGRAAA